MYQSVEVHNFRGLDSVSLDGIAPVTLITGKNNVGKTAVLEAVHALTAGPNPMSLVQINLIRRLPVTIDFSTGTSPWALFFRNFDTTTTVSLSGRYTDLPDRTLMISVVTDRDEIQRIGERGLDQSPSIGFQSTETGKPPPVSLPSQLTRVLRLTESVAGGQETVYYLIADPRGIRSVPAVAVSPSMTCLFMSPHPPSPAEDAQRYSNLEVTRKADVVLRALQVIDPRITDIRLVLMGETPILYGDLGAPHLVPLPATGEGMQRLASIMLAIVSMQLVLVDEIENGFHYSVLEGVWDLILRTSVEFGVQVIATTHSFECVEAFNRASAKFDKEYAVLFRLEHDLKDRLHAIRLDRSTLTTAIENRFEVR